ncbi:hypothetical protein [Kibdelosporangium philippinense]|uniref:hypothetical protein n=1 Tax=Kibdelosporangium philippinense TaxID=211113 RepID=UPI0036225E68
MIRFAGFGAPEGTIAAPGPAFTVADPAPSDPTTAEADSPDTIDGATETALFGLPTPTFRPPGTMFGPATAEFGRSLAVSCCFGTGVMVTCCGSCWSVTSDCFTTGAVAFWFSPASVSTSNASSPL